MAKLLVVVDCQNDFINGSLGTKEAQAIVQNVVKKIKEWDGDIICTLDTHSSDYLNTREGKYLPVEHCIVGTRGHHINREIFDALLFYNGSSTNLLKKYTFGSTALPELVRGSDINYIEIVGIATEICVISNALLLKTHFPELEITVDASCCAGVTPERHKASLTVMKACQINVINEQS